MAPFDLAHLHVAEPGPPVLLDDSSIFVEGPVGIGGTLDSQVPVSDFAEGLGPLRFLLLLRRVLPALDPAHDIQRLAPRPRSFVVESARTVRVVSFLVAIRSPFGYGLGTVPPTISNHEP